MTTTVQLDPKERQLKRLLLDTAAYIDTINDQSVCKGASSNGKQTGQQISDDKLVLRWAGGWVRDKLLGRQSHDIDVAINAMTGEAFGEALRDFCGVPENIKKHDLQKQDIGNIHKIEKNPEKSKNLETATVKIFGLDVDFVNLRTETYAEDSRNPQMEFGTAEEDARRRDATVNALFYNIHTDEVEDFVGGLEDMHAKIIRTPMDPFQTFMDDPLRVLRLVRFASRLGFTLEPNVKVYMGDESVLNALQAKISRERVGVEVEKMLKGEHPRDAVHYIDELGLYHTVFTDPAKQDMPTPDLAGWNTTYEFLDGLSEHALYNKLVTSDEERYLAWVLACIVPFARVPGQVSRSENLKKNRPLATQAAREGIKAPNKVSELVTAAWLHLAEIAELKDLVCSGNERMHERDYLGMAIRRWDAQGKHWRLQVLFAMLDDVMTKSKESPQTASTLVEIRNDWQVFIDQIQKLDLIDAPAIQPMIDGRMLSKAFGIKPGKWLSPALDVCMAWQLRNPQESDPAGAIEEVRRRQEELGIAQLLQ
ncbi:CCA tRNA nucleotidyltransferase, mitochondrial [Gnomoniopsis smithogilvyi]|uniref:CCA tRNA nucleotidyltransferase, mitochondrial n=1 Tax=Gnomoniopsis smithogilvyi TaxID=1191159 RepID=A0A9W8YPM9_9PEZI|nr:CCA tRNA nucleotidyltransferase, mitochondrial [Gnomoniopsis smithogilvyi]